MPVTGTVSYQYADGRQVSYLYNGIDDKLSRVTVIANSPLGQGMRSNWRLRKARRAWVKAVVALLGGVR